MPDMPLKKHQETPASPERLEVEKRAMEGFAEIERELGEAEREGENGQKGEKAKAPVASEPATTPVAAGAIAPLDAIAEKIEDILEEDLMDVYLKMAPNQQMAFKQKGEETVSKIRQLLNAAKVNAKKIFELLREWLKMIPGVNRFFLEQEAKIKTDRILFMNDQEKKM